jgi:hypothetical protein
MEAHVCQKGLVSGTIRPYSAVFCSFCGGRGAVDVEMSEEDIAEYNAKRRPEIKLERAEQFYVDGAMSHEFLSNQER